MTRTTRPASWLCIDLAESGKQAQFRLLTRARRGNPEVPRLRRPVSRSAKRVTRSPRRVRYGNGVACWSISDERYLGFIAASETYGLSRVADGSILASQRDGALLTAWMKLDCVHSF